MDDVINDIINDVIPREVSLDRVTYNNLAILTLNRLLWGQEERKKTTIQSLQALLQASIAGQSKSPQRTSDRLPQE